MNGGIFKTRGIIYFPQITHQTYKREGELEKPVHAHKIAIATVMWYIIQNCFFPVKNKMKFRFLWL